MDDATVALSPEAPFRGVSLSVAPLGGAGTALGPRELVIGSGSASGLRLDDDSVSKRHVALSVEGAAVRVRDLGSRNGTWVGAYRVNDTLVPAGTVLRIGRTQLHIRSADPVPELRPSDHDRFGDLRGGSVAMRQVYAVLERVAAGTATVLLDGETGTGKEGAARGVHAVSARADRAFVVLDCGSVPPDLVESQLFGHARGAFTGAIEDRRGVFEGANGGTLFLDELDSLPLSSQGRLLRALESRTVVRVGEHQERPVDVRVIAACGRAPEALVDAGTLRRDLYFRLAVVRLTMPPLRDRLEDLPALCEDLLRRLGRPMMVPEGPALQRLRGHAWPGNVRELRNVLERAVTLGPPDAAFDELPFDTGGTPVAAPSLDFHEAKAAVIAAWERDWLRAALARTGGNLSKLARESGLTRVHLRELLKRHGLR